MADIVTLTGDPVLQSVSVSLQPPASATVYLCHAVFKSYSGATPIWTEVDVGFDTEFMPSAFFSSTVRAAVAGALHAVGYEASGAWVLPPIADTLEVWDPETNAPYP